MKVSIIGTGNIGTDLLIKLLKLSVFQIIGFVGRRPSTKTLPPSVKYFDNGIDFFIQNPKSCDLVFDCTDATSAAIHAPIFHEQDIIVIDMTPSMIGRMCVPTVKCSYLKNVKNVNMITCGGQVSIPLIKYISSKCIISYAEVVTQISSESAGMATRINIDKYIETTENAIKTIVPSCKVILNVNPCKTTVMQTTIFLKTFKEGNFDDFDDFIKIMKSYIPNYEVSSYPTYTNRTLMVSVKIVGSGDYLSKYAGNLDVINCAAIKVAKIFEQIKISDTPPSCNIYNDVLDI